MGMKVCDDCGEQRSDQPKSVCPNCGNVEEDVVENWINILKLLAFSVIIIGIADLIGCS